MTRCLTAVFVATLGLGAAMQPASTPAAAQPAGDHPMQLGNFSISLTVKDLKASQEFYEKLGFKQVAGMPAQKWVVMQNGAANIGLFQGHIEKNSLTFNPGWDASKKTLPQFQDVRDIQKELRARGVEIKTTADEASTGPAYIVLADPDGNPILIDQHVPKPK